MSDASVRTAHVRSAGGGYPVLVGCGLLDRLPELLQRFVPVHRYALISDHHVAPLYGEPALASCRSAGLKADLFSFPAGEASKTRKHWSILTDRLLEAAFGRDAAVVAIGGGVTGDLAGFVAATYMRGIPVVQVPTSLVAMIDASVGGKTGVDVRAGKNLVGAFHAPSAVIVDPSTAVTLEPQARSEGLAEALKHGAILDEHYFEELVAKAATLLAAEPDAVAEAVWRSVEIKAEVVGEDEREGGRRQILNFGHTLGHAIESASGYSVAHGRAVAAGMVLESRLGERMAITESGTSGRIAAALRQFGLDTPPVRPFLDAALGEHLLHDKKARAGRARYVLLERIGSCHAVGGWSHLVPEELVAEVTSGFESRGGPPLEIT